MLAEVVAIDGCMNGMNVEAHQAAYVRTGAATPCYPSITASDIAVSTLKMATTPGHPITMLEICPLSVKDANTIVARWHRHHGATAGGKFAVGVAAAGEIVGVAIAGRPVAREYDDGWTIEVNRSCTNGYKNANSMLYGAVTRAAFALGYRRIITYTQTDESGASLRATGFRVIAERQPRKGWDTPSRPRVNRNENQGRLLWEVLP